MTQPLVVGQPGALEVKARQRLSQDGVFDQIIEHIGPLIEDSVTSGAQIVIQDCDLSQNHLTKDQFEMLIATLSMSSTCKVLRWRLFGCPTLDDDCLRSLAEYIRGLDKSNAPWEMHLSDCAITTEGFLYLMDVLEESAAYPVTAGVHEQPLYLRIENNYIDESMIKEKIEAGVVRAFKKTQGSRRSAAPASVKVDLIVQDYHSFKQKEGAPPNPEDAPPPKPVSDWGNRQQQQKWDQRGSGKGSGWSSGGWSQSAPWHPHPSWNQKGNNRAGQQALPGWSTPSAKGAQSSYRAPNNDTPRVAPQRSAGKAPWTAQPAPRVQVAQRPAAYSAFRNGGTKAADRSRSPAPVMRGSAAQAAAAAESGSDDLPAPYEEHWSEDYNIPYYWNPITGESLWEKPTK